MQRIRKLDIASDGLQCIRAQSEEWNPPPHGSKAPFLDGRSHPG